MVRQLPRNSIEPRRRRDAESHKPHSHVCDRCHIRSIAECFERARPEAMPKQPKFNVASSRCGTFSVRFVRIKSFHDR